MTTVVTDFERQVIERLRLKVRSEVQARLTDAEMAELPSLQAQADASLACEGMYLSDGEMALAAMLNEERIPPGARIPYLIAFLEEIDPIRRIEAAD